MSQAVAGDEVGRIWEHDPNLWKPGDAAHAREITNRLGWLDVVETMTGNVDKLEQLAAGARAEGVRDVVVLGMGGSSLCPEVFRTSFGQLPDSPLLHVLDTTDPAAIALTSDAINLRNTWFIVASKSGTTLETLSHFAHFWKLVSAGDTENAGNHFIAISDPGSPLVELAREHNFRAIFENPPDIGGRYSALSYFGLVPAALMGIDVSRLLSCAEQMRHRCRAADQAQNPGAALGNAMATHHAAGRDKLTIVAPPPIASFSLWAEQLIAESTGKEGKGVIPIGDEPLGQPADYGSDRFFVYLALGEHADYDKALLALEEAGHPVMRLEMQDEYDLASEFFRWEFAVATVGAALQIDPFDQPNVQESKDNTKRVLGEYQENGRLAAEPSASDDEVSEFLQGVRSGDYVAIMAYVTPTSENGRALQELRVTIRDQQRVATTLGFGPRFLHSTGQLHKGGPNTGVFIQLTQHDASDVEIPGQPFGFSTLKQAQAIGDLKSLQDHQRRVIHIDLGGDVAAACRELTGKLTS